MFVELPQALIADLARFHRIPDLRLKHLFMEITFRALQIVMRHQFGMKEAQRITDHVVRHVALRIAHKLYSPEECRHRQPVTGAVRAEKVVQLVRGKGAVQKCENERVLATDALAVLFKELPHLTCFVRLALKRESFYFPGFGHWHETKLGLNSIERVHGGCHRLAQIFADAHELDGHGSLPGTSAHDDIGVVVVEYTSG